MFATGTATVLLCALAFGARADDNPLVEKVKQLVATVDSYLEDHHKDFLSLPDFGILPVDPLQMRHGRLGKFSSMEVLDVPFINQTTLDDGSVVYTYDILLGLKEFEMFYDFTMNAVISKKQGNFSISAEKNSMLLSGVAVIHPDKSCEAHYKNFHVVEYSGFKIHLEPNDFPATAKVSEYLLNYLTPLLVPLANKALDISHVMPATQQGFSVITCKIFSL